MFLILKVIFILGYSDSWASLVAQLVKNLPAMQETPNSIPGLGRYSLENGWATHSSVLELPWWLSW